MPYLAFLMAFSTEEKDSDEGVRTMMCELRSGFESQYARGMMAGDGGKKNRLSMVERMVESL